LVQVDPEFLLVVWQRNNRTSVDNDTDSEGGAVSNIVTGTYGEKYGIYSKNVTSADAKYFMVEGL